MNKLLEKQKNAEERAKAVKKEIRKLQITEKKRQTKEQNKKDILYAIFRRITHTLEYERDITSPEFDKFLTRDNERALFGLKTRTVEENIEEKVQENPEFLHKDI